MRDAIAITLMFAAITCGLGINRQIASYKIYRGRPLLAGLILTTVMMMWFAIAGIWVLLN
jgi:hypothetical protein